jgi:hypothetical protein
MDKLNSSENQSVKMMALPTVQLKSTQSMVSKVVKRTLSSFQQSDPEKKHPQIKNMYQSASLRMTKE